jgi:hypothetical protein
MHIEDNYAWIVTAFSLAEVSACCILLAGDLLDFFCD